MDPLKQSIFHDIEAIAENTAPMIQFHDEYLEHEGDLTHNEVRGMLVLVRRLKTRLEVLDAEEENKM